MYKALVHVIAKTHQHGVLNQVVQKKPNQTKYQDEICGAIKVDILEDDDKIPILLDCIIYDTNPVHALITVG